MNVHEITNRLARNALMREERGELARKLTPQMRDGYRVAFPVLTPRGKPLLAIALLARADDRLTRLPLSLTGKAVKPIAGHDHVFLLLCFEDEAQWLRQAELVRAVYPEQPEAEEFAAGLNTDHSNDHPIPPEANGVAGAGTMRQAVIECFEDAVRAGLADPIICCLDTSNEMAKELASNHVTALLSRLNAKVFDAHTGELRPIKPVEFGGGVEVQAWPRQLLLSTFREMGAPQSWRDAMSQQLSLLPDGHFWMLGLGDNEQPLLAPMPKPIR